MSRRVAGGEWVRFHPRVYRLPVMPRTWRQRAMAACLWGGDGVVLSFRAAGALWELDGVRRGPVEVTSVRLSGRRLAGVTIHRAHDLPAHDQRVVDGIPVTSPERTLVDLAAVLDERSLELALEDALRRGLTTPDRVAGRVADLGGKGRKGSRSLRRLLDVRQARPAESALEVAVERFLRERGLAEVFVRQYDVWDGERWRRLDWADPVHKVALEADSWRYHAGHEAWARDRARNDLLEALGWRFVSVTARGLRQPDLLEARIVQARGEAA